MLHMVAYVTTPTTVLVTSQCFSGILVIPYLSHHFFDVVIRM